MIKFCDLFVTWQLALSGYVLKFFFLESRLSVFLTLSVYSVINSYYLDTYSYCLHHTINNMTSSKIDIEIWNAKGDFSLWSKKMKALLLQQKCAKALDKI